MYSFKKGCITIECLNLCGAFVKKIIHPQSREPKMLPTTYLS